MRKLTIFLLAVSVFFVACETDFELNASWKEVTVVYGLLDQSQQQQYIKINKAYLGEGDALQMASVTDSSHYTPFNYVDSTGDLQVKIYRVIQVFSTNDSTTSYIELDGEIVFVGPEEKNSGSAKVYGRKKTVEIRVQGVFTK